MDELWAQIMRDIDSVNESLRRANDNLKEVAILIVGLSDEI